MSYYNNDHLEEQNQQVDRQIEAEEIFDENYQTCEEVLSNMRESISDSYNPFLLQFCGPSALMTLIDTGKHQLPSYLQEKPKEKTSEEKLVIPEPISYLDLEPSTLMKFTAIKSQYEEEAEAAQKIAEAAQKIAEQKYAIDMKTWQAEKALQRGQAF